MFQVGDVCRVRQWDDMAAEFGLDHYGEIRCDASFTPSMRGLCGKEFVIAEDKGDKSYDSHVYKPTNIKEFGYWTITGHMLEYANEYDDETSYDAGFLALICDDLCGATRGDRG